jgi:chitin disaccharide deacetylase
VKASIALIVNADDFGLTPGINRGIVEAHERGIVTSASLMVARRGAVEAARDVRAHPRLGVGLHAEISRWRAPRRPPGFAWSEARLAEKAASELEAQLGLFRRLLGRDPTHIDSHQHRHRAPWLRPLFEELAAALEVPLRHFTPEVTFCGEFYGHDARGRADRRAISPTALIDLLSSLPRGVTELCSHPGYTDGLGYFEGRRIWYRNERELEVRTLCDPGVRSAVAERGIELITFRDLAARTRPEAQQT